MRPSASVRGHVPVVLAVDVGDEVAASAASSAWSCSLRLIWLGPGVTTISKCGSVLGDGLAVGPDEPRLGLAAGLEPDGQVLAGLLAGELDRRAPLVLGVEEVDRVEPLGVEAVQLEAAVADRDR